MDREMTAQFAEIRGLMDGASGVAEMRQAILKMCEVLEMLTENVEFLNEGEEGEMVSYPH